MSRTFTLTLTLHIWHFIHLVALEMQLIKEKLGRTAETVGRLNWCSTAAAANDKSSSIPSRSFPQAQPVNSAQSQQYGYLTKDEEVQSTSTVYGELTTPHQEGPRDPPISRGDRVKCNPSAAQMKLTIISPLASFSNWHILLVPGEKLPLCSQAPEVIGTPSRVAIQNAERALLDILFLLPSLFTFLLLFFVSSLPFPHHGRSKQEDDRPGNVRI